MCRQCPTRRSFAPFEKLVVRSRSSSNRRRQTGLRLATTVFAAAAIPSPRRQLCSLQRCKRVPRRQDEVEDAEELHAAEAEREEGAPRLERAQLLACPVARQSYAPPQQSREP